MSCAPFTTIPQPPTLLPACAVPVGGSNSSILDACCNGHINAIATYSADDSEDDDGCFQYCITDSPDIVQSCLAQKMQEYEKDGSSGVGGGMYGCFNADKAVRQTGGSGSGNEGGYATGAGVRVGGSWVMSFLLGLSVLGAVMGGM
jgi:hypothetical protein